jgi:putative serine protease PepD
MSSNDRTEPLGSPDPDPETGTQPLPTGGADPGQPGGEAAAAGARPPGDAGDPSWPFSWAQAPAEPPAPGPAPGQPPSTPPASGPAWGQPPSDPPASGSGWGQPPSGPPAPDAGWGQAPSGPPASGSGWGQARDESPGQPPEWGQGGGGSPTAPGWGERPGAAGTPGGRGRVNRLLAGAVAGVVLLAGGYGIGQVLDRNSAAAAGGAGIPTAAASAPIQAGDEPVAAVAKALLPTVVQLEVDTQQGNGLGSGVIYDKNGYILTAAHVIDRADQVTVRLSDGTRLRGEVLGTDTGNDVGVVKVDRNNLPAAPLAIDVPLKVGQLAVAIGSPFRLEGSVTAGIVSATNRILQDQQGSREVIQTDAPINPGNSGGVLADREGRVIGINSAIRSDGASQGNIGIGFAVPIDVAARSAQAIVQGKPVQTAYMGVSLNDSTTAGRGGALIAEVASGGPAADAGLEVGDLVVEVDGQAVGGSDDLVGRIRDHQPGDKVTLKVVRDGRERTVTVTLGERPAG